MPSPPIFSHLKQVHQPSVRFPTNIPSYIIPFRRLHSTSKLYRWETSSLSAYMSKFLCREDSQCFVLSKLAQIYGRRSSGMLDSRVEVHQRPFSPIFLCSGSTLFTQDWFSDSDRMTIFSKHSFRLLFYFSVTGTSRYPISFFFSDARATTQLNGRSCIVNMHIFMTTVLGTRVFYSNIFINASRTHPNDPHSLSGPHTDQCSVYKRKTTTEYA
ncbi:hypothetical protein BDN70DRAFT_682706 [Pholiota conissans]|uniref:Uncharacterized protein n=1 Tax=Pholiota conissans TaxID=109636 RepID=A0A9P6CUH6_9AGAR|nr:hypothetical protein BDN70DRAFT_682706 [Pholiota conissans]